MAVQKGTWVILDRIDALDGAGAVGFARWE